MIKRKRIEEPFGWIRRPAACERPGIVGATWLNCSLSSDVQAAAVAVLLVARYNR